MLNMRFNHKIICIHTTHTLFMQLYYSTLILHLVFQSLIVTQQCRFQKSVPGTISSEKFRAFRIIFYLGVLSLKFKLKFEFVVQFFPQFLNINFSPSFFRSELLVNHVEFRGGCQRLFSRKLCRLSESYMVRGYWSSGQVWIWSQSVGQFPGAFCSYNPYFLIFQSWNTHEPCGFQRRVPETYF